MKEIKRKQSSPVVETNKSNDVTTEDDNNASSQTISTDFFEVDGDSLTFKVDPPDYLDNFLSLFGTKSEPMACDVTAQFIQTVSPSGNIKPEHTPKLNAMMAMMEGISPKNEHEALIGSQMVVTHNLGLEFLARASNPLQNAEVLRVLLPAWLLAFRRLAKCYLRGWR